MESYCNLAASLGRFLLGAAQDEKIRLSGQQGSSRRRVMGDRAHGSEVIDSAAHAFDSAPAGSTGATKEEPR